MGATPRRLAPGRAGPYLAAALPVPHRVADEGRVGDHVGAVDAVDGLALRESGQVSVVKDLIAQLGLQEEGKSRGGGQTHTWRRGRLAAMGRGGSEQNGAKGQRRGEASWHTGLRPHRQ